jgi:hypothetical protein
MANIMVDIIAIMEVMGIMDILAVRRKVRKTEKRSSKDFLDKGIVSCYYLKQNALCFGEARTY